MYSTHIHLSPDHETLFTTLCGHCLYVYNFQGHLFPLFNYFYYECWSRISLTTHNPHELDPPPVEYVSQFSTMTKKLIYYSVYYSNYTLDVYGFVLSRPVLIGLYWIKRINTAQWLILVAYDPRQKIPPRYLPWLISVTSESGHGHGDPPRVFVYSTIYPNTEN